MSSKKDFRKINSYLSNLPGVNLIEKYKIFFLNSIPESVIEKLKIHLTKLEGAAWAAMTRFEIAIYDLLDDWRIEYEMEDVIIFFRAKSNEFNKHLDSSDLFNTNDQFEIICAANEKIELLLKEALDIEAQINRISLARNDEKFINLFKNSSTEALLVKKTSELIFIKKTVFASALEHVCTSKLYAIFNLNESKMNVSYDNGHTGYNISITQEYPSIEKCLFIYDFNLLGSGESYQRKGLGRYLEREIVQIALKDNCYKIRGELSPIDMENQAHKERLIGFWTSMGYTIKNREIVKLFQR